MTEIHRNLIFFDKNKRTRTWINEEEMDEFRYHQGPDHADQQPYIRTSNEILL